MIRCSKCLKPDTLPGAEFVDGVCMFAEALDISLDYVYAVFNKWANKEILFKLLLTGKWYLKP